MPLQGEWDVLKPAVEQAGELVTQGRQQFLILDRDDRFRTLLHRHPETGQRALVEFSVDPVEPI